MENVVLSFGIVFLVSGVILFAAVQIGPRIEEGHKRALEVLLSALQAGALAAGGFWVALKYVAGEADLLTVRTAPSLTVTTEHIDLENRATCRIVVTWGLKNHGLRSARIVNSSVTLRRYDPADFLGHDNQEAAFLEDDAIIQQTAPLDTFESGEWEDLLKPGAYQSLTKAFLVPTQDRPPSERYRVTVKLFLEDDPVPWTLTDTSPCAQPERPGFPGAPTTSMLTNAADSSREPN